MPSPSIAIPVAPTATAVKAQFAAAPSLESITRQMLAQAIAQTCPTLKIDLTRTQLAVPMPNGGWELQPFMQRVMDYLGSGTALDLSPVNAQPYYLSDDAPNRLKPDQGELDMQDIEKAVKELTWRLPIGLQNALNDFWAAPSHATGISRWQWLSDTLKDTLSISVLKQTNLSNNARDAINQVILFPVSEDRTRQYGERATRAYWLKTSLINNSTRRSALSPSVVLESANQALIFRVDGNISAYPSLDELGKAWSRRINRLYTADEIHITRFELDGNVFDVQAAAIQNRQSEKLGALTLPTTVGWQGLQAVFDDITDTSLFFANAPTADLYTLNTLKQQLPDWLVQASPATQALYRQYSVAWARAKKNSRGQTYLNNIADIRTYAAQVLHQQMVRDQITFEPSPSARAPESMLDPNDIELTFLIATGLPDTVGIVERITMTLTELSLKNLIGRPKGVLTLRHRLGVSLPEWLTPAYITHREGLIEQVNIGQAYPQQLENLLLSDTPEAKVREQLFAEQLRVQLPLQALEHSLKKEHAITPLGARYVAALMEPGTTERQLEGLPIVIRRLALVRKPEALPDIVNNMYIIEPSDVEKGPHLLYRPFYTQSLLEFPTRSALLDAIAQPGDLQNSVLTWLNDIARPIYDNGGFTQPHYVRFGLGSEFDPLEVPAPARLATNGISNELLQFMNNDQLTLYLYGCNARALVDQASAESVSNRESRWQALFEGGNLIFNSLLLLPGLPRPLMLAGWFLSVASAARQDIPALASDDATERELAAADVLLNVGMLLFHLNPVAAPQRARGIVALSKKTLRPFAPSPIAELWPEPPFPKVLEGIVALPGDFPNTESTALDFSFASARNRLTPSQRERLQLYSVPAPDPLPVPQSSGPHKGLYLFQNKWHVLLDQQLYAIALNTDGTATILSPSDSAHPGPNVKVNDEGQWSLDLRLRLQGGMGPKRIAAFQQKKTARMAQLETELQATFQQEEPLHRTVEIIQSALQAARADQHFALEKLATLNDRFNGALKNQFDIYQQLLDSQKERTELGIPLSARIVLSLLEKIFDNKNKALANGLYEQRFLVKKWPTFTTPSPELEPASEADPEGFMQYMREQVEFNTRSIQHLERRNSALEQLSTLSEAGAEAANRLASELSPNEHTPLTLRSFQMSCLKLASTKVMATRLVERGLDEAIDPLQVHLRTHGELNSFEFPPSKRLEVLDSLVSQYGQALDALQGISLVHAEELEPAYFEQLRQLLNELYQDVVAQLAGEIKPTSAPRKSSRKRTPSASGKPQKKVINTREKGPLIGDLKPAGAEWPIEVIEIRSAYDNQLLSTYSQQGEEWVEIETVRAKPTAATRALNVIKGDARKLYAMFEMQLYKARQYKAQCKHPVEIEELFNLEASRLDTLATELHHAYQAQPHSAQLPGDQTLIDDMRLAAKTFTHEGKTLRIELSLQLAPTHGNLQYLLDQGHVQIARLGERLALQGERRDFIQEYTVNDKKGFALWYAHFHYAETTDPKQSYTVAHLKTKAQRKQSYYSQLANAQSGHAIVNVHRGQIGKLLAERWFLPLAP